MPNAHLLRIPLDDTDGDTPALSVVAEVEASASGVVRVARPGEVAATAARSLRDSFDQIRAAAEVALDRLSSLSVRPKTVELELGVKFSAEAGAIIARTAAEGNVVVRLSWEPSDAGPDTGTALPSKHPRPV
jgi:hypothetical protein